jgi:hypothetical protein
VSEASAVLRSEWSVPPAHAPRRAIDHHVARYAAWMRRAGAEPRFALILCAGKGAKRRLIDGLSAHGVDVFRAPSTPERPLPKAILDHQGDHFNDRLFLIDGFEDGDPEPLFEALNLQKGQLTKTATWVGLCIESLASLRTLYGEAQGLLRAAERTVLVLAAGAGMEDPVPEALERLWSANGDVAEQVFADALTPKHPTTYDAFSRLVRAGYVADFLGTDIHPDRRQLVELWADRDASALDLSDASPTVAAAMLRHAEGLSAETQATLAAAAQADPHTLVATEQPIRSQPFYQAMGAVERIGRGEATLDPMALEGLLYEVKEVQSPAAKVHAWLAAASAHAASGALQPCVDAVGVACALANPPVPLEVSFRAYEKAVQLDTYRGARTAGQRGVDRLGELANALQSPFYDARELLARAQFTEPLDPRRALTDYHNAHTLFAGHGYPSWAQDAHEGVQRCR